MLDIATLLGFILAVSFMAASILMGGGSMGAFVDAPSVIVTIGGSLATVMIMFPIKTFLSLPKVIKRVFLYKVPNTQDLVDLLVSLTESARRDGLLSLERRLGDIDNPFLVLGLQMAVDGTPPELIDSVLRTEMETSYNRNKQGKALIDQLGKMGPAFGMIGTLLGLILMLGNLSDPDALGPGMAVAMITTLYGAVLANVMCIPFSEKLAYITQQEMLAMEITIRGVLSIRDGDSPRSVEQKLSAFGMRRAA
jgi:chemotaxis protein MotA